MEWRGVAFAFRKLSAWAARKLELLSPLRKQFYDEGRLMAVQLHRSSERRSLVAYVLYGVSGARWEQGIRQVG